MHDAHAYPHPYGFGAGCEPRANRKQRKLAQWAAMQGGQAEGHARHRHDRDFGPFGGAEFGFGPRGFGRGGRGGRRRMRRGDVRAAILVLLDEEPRNGYQLMQEIEQRSDGAWRPSPGSVYPALSQLEDEALVKAEESEGRKQFTLTDEGRSYVAEHREKLGEPWSDLNIEVGEGVRGLSNQIKPLMGAISQVLHSGDEVAAKRAAEILAEARKKLYGILAEDEPQDTK